MIFKHIVHSWVLTFLETEIELAECNTFCMTSAYFGNCQLRLNLAIEIHILHFIGKISIIFWQTE